MVKVVFTTQIVWTLYNKGKNKVTQYLYVLLTYGLHLDLLFKLVLFSCFTFEREICYQNIYSNGHIICKLVTLWEKSRLRFKMLTLPIPPAPSFVLPLTPETPRLKSVDLFLQVTEKYSSTILIWSVQNADCRPGTKCRLQTRLFSLHT